MAKTDLIILTIKYAAAKPHFIHLLFVTARTNAVFTPCGYSLCLQFLLMKNVYRTKMVVLKTIGSVYTQNDRNTLALLTENQVVL